MKPKIDDLIAALTTEKAIMQSCVVTVETAMAEKADPLDALRRNLFVTVCMLDRLSGDAPDTLPKPRATRKRKGLPSETEPKL